MANGNWQLATTTATTSAMTRTARLPIQTARYLPLSFRRRHLPVATPTIISTNKISENLRRFAIAHFLSRDINLCEFGVCLEAAKPQAANKMRFHTCRRMGPERGVGPLAA